MANCSFEYDNCFFLKAVDLPSSSSYCSTDANNATDANNDSFEMLAREELYLRGGEDSTLDYTNSYAEIS